MSSCAATSNKLGKVSGYRYIIVFRYFYISGLCNIRREWALLRDNGQQS